MNKHPHIATVLSGLAFCGGLTAVLVLTLPAMKVSFMSMLLGSATSGASSCNVTAANIFDGIDNNCNGLIDLSDPTRDGLLSSVSGSASSCVLTTPSTTDGVDNNCNGMIDLSDPTRDGVSNSAASVSAGPCTPTTASMTDLVDNNCNQLIDFADPTWEGLYTPPTGPQNPPPQPYSMDWYFQNPSFFLNPAPASV